MSSASNAVESGRERSLRGDAFLHGVALMLLLTVVQRVIGFVRNIVVCRVLEPDQLGAWNLAESFLVLAAPLIVWGVPGSFARYLEYYRQRGQLFTFLRRTVLATCSLTVVGIAAMLPLRQTGAWMVFGSSSAVGLFVATVLTVGVVIAFNVGVELLTALRQVRAVAWLRFVNSLLFTVCVLLLFAWHADAMSVIGGYAMACLVTGVSAAWLVRKTVRSAPGDRSSCTRSVFWLKLMPFAVWFWLSDLLMNLFSAIDRYMILHFSDAGQVDPLSTVGQYHSSRILGVLLIAVTGILASTLLSYLSHDWELGRRDLVRRKLDFALKGTALGLTIATSLVLMIAPWVFQLVLANKYLEGFQVLPLTMVYCIWFGLLTIVNIYLWCCERAWLASVSVGLGLLVNVVLNYLWLPRWGLQGAVLATVVANGFVLLVTLYLTTRLGMKYQPLTLAALGLPLTLCAGPWMALVVVAGVLVLAGRMGRLLTRFERRHVAEAWEPLAARWLRGDASAA